MLRGMRLKTMVRTCGGQADSTRAQLGARSVSEVTLMLEKVPIITTSLKIISIPLRNGPMCSLQGDMI